MQSLGENGNEKCVGKYGLGQRNRREEQLIEFCNQQQLVATNTLFKNHKRRIYTWKAPGDSDRYQLDYNLKKRKQDGGWIAGT